MSELKFTPLLTMAVYPQAMSAQLSAGYISAPEKCSEQAVTPAELSMFEIYGFDYDNVPEDEIEARCGESYEIEGER